MYGECSPLLFPPYIVNTPILRIYVSPGASVPFGMVSSPLPRSFFGIKSLNGGSQVKFSTDLTGYAPAGPYSAYLCSRPSNKLCDLGYVTDPTQTIRGLSPLHDSGTGSSLGTATLTFNPIPC